MGFDSDDKQLVVARKSLALFLFPVEKGYP